MAKQSHHSPNWGGPRPGAGRKPGSRPRYCKEKEALLRRLVDQEGVEDPIEALLRIAGDPSVDPKIRISAAGTALPYVTPRLSEVKVEAQALSGPLETKAELERQAIALGMDPETLWQPAPALEPPESS